MGGYEPSSRLTEEAKVGQGLGWRVWSRWKRGRSFSAQGPRAESQGSEPTRRPHERAQRCAGGGPREHAHGQRGASAVAGVLPHYHVRYTRACEESR